MASPIERTVLLSLARLLVDDLHWWHVRNGAPSSRPECSGSCQIATELIGPGLYSGHDAEIIARAAEQPVATPEKP